jgi:hypothetical protein
LLTCERRNRLDWKQVPKLVYRFDASLGRVPLAKHNSLEQENSSLLAVEHFEVPDGLCHWNTLFQRPTGLEVLQFLLDIAAAKYHRR